MSHLKDHSKAARMPKEISAVPTTPHPWRNLLQTASLAFKGHKIGLIIVIEGYRQLGAPRSKSIYDRVSHLSLIFILNFSAFYLAITL
jgi:hypothetical protein